MRMKVQAIREIRSGRTGQTIYIREAAVEPCCAAMREAWQKRAVGFGAYDKTFNVDEHVNIYRCKLWPGGTAWDNYAIRFCPFCGTTIEVTIHDAAAPESA